MTIQNYVNQKMFFFLTLSEISLFYLPFFPQKKKKKQKKPLKKEINNVITGTSQQR